MRALAVSAAAVAAVAIAACSGTPAMEAPAPWSPVGTYDFSTVVQGQTVGGSMTITGEGDMLSGIIEPEAASGMPPIPLETVEVAGKEVTITAEVQGELMFMALTFAEDDTFDGSWSVAGDGGDVTGVRTGN